MAKAVQIQEAPEVSIDEAKPFQVLDVYRLFQDWHKSCGVDFPPPEEGPTLQWLLHTIRAGRVFLAYLDGPKHTHILAGAFGVQLSTLPWAPEGPQILTDAFFYVPRAHHQWGVPKALVQTAQMFAATRQIPLVVTLISGRKGARADRFFNLDDGALIGGTFCFGLSEE